MITKDLFAKALTNSKAVRPQDMELLNVWATLPERALTAEKVIEVTGAKRASLIVNNMGKRIAAFLEVEVEVEVEGTASSVIAQESSAAWIMHDELAAALGNESSEEVIEVETATAETAETAEAIEKVAAETAETVEYEEAEEGSLKARLIEFDKNVVRAAYPNTRIENRLLNPGMVNALVAAQPVNKSLYHREVPSELRTRVNPQEAKMFLNKVLNILKNKPA